MKPGPGPSGSGPLGAPMVDLILIAVIVAAFFGGFYCGNKFASLKTMFASLKAALADWFR